MVYLILGTGFEEIEALAPLDIIRRAGVEIKSVGISGKMITGGHGITVEADISIDEVNSEDLDMIILPGGTAGVESIKKSQQAIELIKYAHDNEKTIAAICAAPVLLAQLGYLNGRKAVCHPNVEEKVYLGGALLQKDSPVTSECNLVTGRAAGASIEFGLKLVSLLSGQETAETIRKAICHGPGTKPLI